MTTLRNLLIALLLVGGLIAAIAFKLADNRDRQAAEVRKAATVPLPTVALANVTLDTVRQDTELTGVTEANQTLEVRSETDGKITHLGFALGDHVAAGHVLARLEATVRRANLRAAQLTLDKYRRDLKKYESLRQANHLSEQDFANALLATQTAETQLTLAQKQLADATLTAPIAGYVVRKSVGLGSVLQLGTAVATLADVSRLRVRVLVGEQTALQLRPGQPATVRTDAYPGHDYAARVQAVGVQSTEAGTFPVEITLPNPPQWRLLAGAPVRVSLSGPAPRTLLTVPRAALIGSDNIPAVWTVENGLARRRIITTGEAYGTRTVVRSGLQVGEQVVVSGQQELREGQRVAY